MTKYYHFGFNQDTSVKRIVVLTFLVMGFGVTMIAVKTSQEVRSRADQLQVQPSAFLTVRPLPPLSLKSPYIRLVVNRTNFKLTDSIPVEVYLKTELPVVEANLVVKFAAQVLALDKNNIKSSDVFKTFSVDKNLPGLVNLTFFNNTQVGYSPVVSEQEVKIAELNFIPQIITPNTQVGLEFISGDTTLTSLIQFTPERPEKVENILKGVAGTSFEITP